MLFCFIRRECAKCTTYWTSHLARRQNIARSSKSIWVKKKGEKIKNSWHNSLSLYRHPFLYTLFSSRFTLIINNNRSFRVGVSIVGTSRSRDTLRMRRARCLWCWISVLPMTDKIRKYRTDYNNNPPDSVVFMSVIPSTSERLHSEFVWLLFLQAHRETDRFFATSGVQLVESTSGYA